MATPEEIAFGLTEIALNLRYWLEWNKKERDAEPHLTTDDSTSIICVPPTWPTRGQLKLWAETMEAARDYIHPSSHPQK